MCLLLSALVHLATVAALPRPVSGAKAPATLVLLLRGTSAEPVTPPTSAAPVQRQGFAPVRPRVRHRSPLGRRAPPTTPVTSTPAATAPAVARVALLDVQQAYNSLSAAQETEKLTEAQQRVPRGNTLSQGPQELEPIRPIYPPDELKRGERALVLLEVFISAGGAVEDVVVLDDEGKRAFAAAAAQAVRSTAFRPGQAPQGPVRSRTTLGVRFTFE